MISFSIKLWMKNKCSTFEQLSRCPLIAESTWITCSFVLLKSLLSLSNRGRFTSRKWKVVNNISFTSLAQHCVESVQIRSFFWFAFSCIRSVFSPYLDTFYAVQLIFHICEKQYFHDRISRSKGNFWICGVSLLLKTFFQNILMSKKSYR